jgi:hypothetical protein
MLDGKLPIHESACKENDSNLSRPAPQLPSHTTQSSNPAVIHEAVARVMGRIKCKLKLAGGRVTL